jgi:hypothetical protein
LRRISKTDPWFTEVVADLEEMLEVINLEAGNLEVRRVESESSTFGDGKQEAELFKSDNDLACIWLQFADT